MASPTPSQTVKKKLIQSNCADRTVTVLIGNKVLCAPASTFFGGLIALPHVMPALGRATYIVRGGSMEPALPIGSVVIVQHVDPAQLGIGDIVTFTAANNTTVTHRITEVVPGAQLGFHTKGDASLGADGNIN